MATVHGTKASMYLDLKLTSKQTSEAGSILCELWNGSSTKNVSLGALGLKLVWCRGAVFFCTLSIGCIIHTCLGGAAACIAEFNLIAEYNYLFQPSFYLNRKLKQQYHSPSRAFKYVTFLVALYKDSPFSTGHCITC